MTVCGIGGWLFHQFEAPDEVGQIVRQIAPFLGLAVLLEVLLVWYGEGLGGRNVGKGALLLPRGRGKGINGIGLQREREGTVLGGDVLQTYELLCGIAVPDA